MQFNNTSYLSSFPESTHLSYFRLTFRIRNTEKLFRKHNVCCANNSIHRAKKNHFDSLKSVRNERKHVTVSELCCHIRAAMIVCQIAFGKSHNMYFVRKRKKTIRIQTKLNLDFESIDRCDSLKWSCSSKRAQNANRWRIPCIHQLSSVIHSCADILYWYLSLVHRLYPNNRQNAFVNMDCVYDAISR